MVMGMQMGFVRSYHSSMKSDLSDLDLVTEIIREKLFRRFNKELPYSFEQENVYVYVLNSSCYLSLADQRF